MTFETGKTVKPLAKIGESKRTGTKVRFLADDTIFESREYEYDVLEKRFREMAFLTKGLKITFEDQRGEEPKRAEFCFCLSFKLRFFYFYRNNCCYSFSYIFTLKIRFFVF